MRVGGRPGSPHLLSRAKDHQGLDFQAPKMLCLVMKHKLFHAVRMEQNIPHDKKQNILI